MVLFLVISYFALAFFFFAGYLLQKSTGLPTSDLFQNEEMMKFMARHPNMASNMNFSGAGAKVA